MDGPYFTFLYNIVFPRVSVSFFYLLGFMYLFLIYSQTLLQLRNLFSIYSNRVDSLSIRYFIAVFLGASWPALIWAPSLFFGCRRIIFIFHYFWYSNFLKQSSFHELFFKFPKEKCCHQHNCYHCVHGYTSSTFWVIVK